MLKWLSVYVGKMKRKTSESCHGEGSVMYFTHVCVKKSIMRSDVTPSLYRSRMMVLFAANCGLEGKIVDGGYAHASSQTGSGRGTIVRLVFG